MLRNDGFDVFVPLRRSSLPLLRLRHELGVVCTRLAMTRLKGLHDDPCNTSLAFGCVTGFLDCCVVCMNCFPYICISPTQRDEPAKSICRALILDRTKA